MRALSHSTATRQPGPFVQYWANLWQGITTVVSGMRVTLRYIFTPKVTNEYPEVLPTIPAGARGMHELIESDCVVCMSCAKICPVDCIRIESLGRGKNQLLTRFSIDYSRCLFCELCSDSCSSAAIRLGPNYDMAGYSRSSVVLELSRPKSQEEIDAFKAELARIEEEKKRKAAEAAATKKAGEAGQAEA